MLKPALTDLHETYKTRNSESFIQKLQQFIVKVKELCKNCLQKIIDKCENFSDAITFAITKVFSGFRLKTLSPKIAFIY